MKEIIWENRSGTSFVILLDEEDFECFGKLSWLVNKTSGYVMRWRCENERFPGTKKGNMIHLSREITKCPDGYDVDHINGNKLDNRRRNLRVCSRKMNAQNRNRVNRNNISGFKGVYFERDRQLWACSWTTLDGTRKRKSMFNTAQEAANFYDDRVIETYGDYAKPNKSMRAT